MVDKCYSLEMHAKAYGNVVFPCRDKSEWEKMQGPVILHPLFKKQVGRPTKSRRKAPYEVDARGGGKIMTRHGVIMHCTYCKFPDHNRAGCKWLKAGLAPPSTSDQVVPPTDQVVPPTDPEPAVTQEQDPVHNHPIGRSNDDLLVNSLINERPTERYIEARPTAESTFIREAQTQLSQSGTSTDSTNTIRQGELAQRLLQMQQDKNRANEERKIAVLEAKYQADMKTAEEKAKKQLEQQKLKAERAQAKALLDAEKREKKRQDAEITKKAKEETRKFVKEVKQQLAEKNKKEAAERKAEEKRIAAEKKEAERKAQKEAQSKQSKNGTTQS